MKYNALHYLTCIFTATAFIFVWWVFIPFNANSETKHTKVTKSSATRVLVDPVKYETKRQTTRVMGRLLSLRTGPVVSRTAGVIQEFRVEVGDRVVKGQVIAVLMKERLTWEHRLKKAEVQHHKAQVQTKRRQISLLKQELKRLDTLRNSPAFSQARLDDKKHEITVAESTVSEAAARLKMARATLQLTAIGLYDAEIRAPFSGIISKRPTEIGAYVSIGTHVATVINEESMEIVADIPARNALKLNKNVIVDVELDGEIRVEALIRAIIPKENPRTRTIEIRLTPKYTTPKPKVAINHPVAIFIPTGPPQKIITVHKDAVLVKNGKRAVFVAEENKAHMRFIKLGEANGSRFTVIHGLQPQDLVVIRGNERLRPGSLIRYTHEPNTVGNRQKSQPKTSGLK